MPSSSAHARDVLVVGDWYVDAHWVVEPHQSSTASRAGRNHSLAVHEIDETVRVLCGAGKVASLLTSGMPGRKVYGLGSWAQGDDEFIQALVNGNNAGDNPLRLRSRIVPASFDDGHQRVFNLSHADTAAGTNRVIRIYRRASPEKFELVDRLDFETATDHDKLDLDVLPDDLPGRIGAVLVKDHGHGVVEKVIAKLAARFVDAQWFVSSKVWNPAWLEELRGSDVRLLLFQQEAAAAASTADATFPEIGSWFVEQRVPTRKALIALDEVHGKFRQPRTREAPVVAVLPARDSLIARLPEHATDQMRVRGYVHVGKGEEAHERFVPRASALFASLFYFHGQRAPWEDALPKALEFTARWTRKEAARISSRRWKSNDEVFATAGAHPASAGAPTKTRSFDWNDMTAEYEQAFAGWPRPSRTPGAPDLPGFGLIRREGDEGIEFHLELWRAQSEVSGVISIVRAKRRLLAQLAHEFEDFVRHPHTSKSFMIVDDPGGGKSTLVKGLARHRNLRLLTLNITELTRRIDLLAFFDTIVTTQAQDPDKPLLIFVDEINALLENHTVYSAFLAPLEDGHYNRDGKSFIIKPCIWVFVGTDDLGTQRQDHRTDLTPFQRVQQSAREAFAPRQGSTSDLEERERDRAQKKSDFSSRLTLPPFVLNQPFARRASDDLEQDRLEKAILAGVENLDSDGRLAELNRTLSAPVPSQDIAEQANRRIAGRLIREGQALERVYLGVAMILRMHPGVQKISLKVIKAFAYLEDGVTLRDLRHDIDRLVNVQRGEIKWNNFPRSFELRRARVRTEAGLLVRRPGTTLKKMDFDPADDEIMVRVWNVRPREED